MRRLLVRERIVSHDVLSQYDVGWALLAEAAASTGTHAWRFCDPQDSTRALEFIEWKSESAHDGAEHDAVDIADGSAPQRVLDAAAALENIAPSSHAFTWHEWPRTGEVK